MKTLSEFESETAALATSVKEVEARLTAAGATVPGLSALRDDNTLDALLENNTALKAHMATLTALEVSTKAPASKTEPPKAGSRTAYEQWGGKVAAAAQSISAYEAWSKPAATR